MGFFSRLEARVRQVDSLLCVGLDPHVAELSSPTVEAARAFCLRLVDATADLAAAYKPNTAFFEVFGADGLRLLEQLIAAIPDGIPVILDAKREDIASSSTQARIGLHPAWNGRRDRFPARPTAPRQKYARAVTQ